MAVCLRQLRATILWLGRIQAIFAVARNFNPARREEVTVWLLSKSVRHSLGWTGMEISGRPIAGFGPGIAKRVPGSSAANPPRCSVFVSYGSSLRHFRVSHRDPVQSPVCSRDLRCGSLLRDIVDPALVASEATKITNAITGTRKSNCWCLVSPLCSKPLRNRVRGWSSQGFSDTARTLTQIFSPNRSC